MNTGLRPPWRSAHILRALFALLLLAAGAVAAAPEHPLRVVVISDLNESYGSTRYSTHVTQAVRRIEQLRPALVLSTGDMVAGQRLAPPLTRPELEAMWASFHHTVSDPLARAAVPFAVVAGNHDAAAGERFALEREVFRAQWLPRKPALDYVDAAGYPFRYAFAVGPVLFVALDATAVGHLPDSEKRWLAELLQARGAGYRYRVVFSHLPLWPFTEGRATEILGDPALERILQQHRVDLVLSGHHHAYYPGVKDGLRYVSQACLGAAARPLLGTRQRAEHAITVIEFPTEGGAPLVEAYRAPDFTEPIHRHTLPAQIVSPRATLVRDDLADPRLSENARLAAPPGSR